MDSADKNQSFEDFALERKASRRIRILSLIIGALVVIFGGTYFFTMSAPRIIAPEEPFVVPLNATPDKIANLLGTQGFVRHPMVFEFVLKLRGLNGMTEPGAYTISKSMNVWQITSVLSDVASGVWVVIPEGLRKEEIAELLAAKLQWTSAEKTKWISTDSTRNWTAVSAPVDQGYSEGVYFPETYLLPVGEAPTTTARRLQVQFAQEYAPYAQEVTRQNIKWTTLIKIASIIQREAHGASDMPLISGIIWNRLLGSMPLDIDATVQYARDSALYKSSAAAVDWWAPLRASAIRQTDSPYNTYLHAGLPPTPICNPGLDAIKAALFPSKTDCLYYLHDSAGQIHCSATYAGQQQNIQKYLR